MLYVGSTNQIFVNDKFGQKLEFKLPIDEKKVKLICAGGTKSFAVLKETSDPSLDFCKMKIPILTLSVFKELAKHHPKEISSEPSAKKKKIDNSSALSTLEQPEFKELKRAFSSSACLNASSFSLNHHNINDRHPRVDFTNVWDVSSLFESLKNDELDQFICSKLISIFEIDNECTCCESLRIFMIVPFIFVKFSTLKNNQEKLFIAYANAFMRRQQNAKGSLITHSALRV